MAKVFTLTQFVEGLDIRSGTANPENFSGTPETDVFLGQGGNDTMNGNAGDDFLLGNSGNDSINGGAGDDFLFVSDDTDTAIYVQNNFSGPNSTIQLASDRQFLIDQWFDLFVFAQIESPGTDITIAGGDGFDTAVIDLSFFQTGIGVNFTLGAPGAAFKLPNGVTNVTGIEAIWFQGTQDNDTITSGSNSDRVYGDFGNDNLDGGAGDDVVFGGAGTDNLTGGDGNDFIVSTNFYSHFELDLTTGIPFEFIHGLNAVEVQILANFPTEADIQIDGGTGNDIALLDFSNSAAAVNFVVAPNAIANGTVVTSIEGIWAIDSLNKDVITGGALDDQFLSIDAGIADKFDGRGGEDTYVAQRQGQVTIDLSNSANNDGAAKGDTLTSIENVIGSDLADDITGSAVDNKLWGSLGADTLSGGDGNDVLDGGNGNGVNGDQLNGGLGTDVASYASSVLSVKVDMLNIGDNTNDAAGDSYTEVENLLGTRFGDTLLADDNANEVDGSLGQDTINGRAGDDRLIGNAGNDSVTGDDGIDTAVFSGNRSDYTVTAIAGGFTITDNRGVNFDGTDTVKLVENFEFADQTRAAKDLINIAPANFALSNNVIAENSAIGTVIGLLSATDDDGDALTFSESGVGGSALFNVSGNQLVVASALDFEKLGGGPQNITLIVNDGNGHAVQQVFAITVTNVDPEPILGDNTSNTLFGTSAADIMRAFGGKDILVGSAGADFMDGGASADTVRYDNAVRLDLTDASSSTGDAQGDRFREVEAFQFSKFGDSAKGNGLANIFFGNDGNDTFSGQGGDDVLSGGGGADVMSGGDGNDKMFSSSVANPTGASSGDLLNGANGNDTLVGSNGVDTLVGALDNDVLNGNAGKDLLVGGAGRDVMAGGGDADVFDFNLTTESSTAAATRDIITDFAHLVDDIDLSTIDARTTPPGNQAFVFIGTAAFTGEGQIRVAQSGTSTLVSVNTTGAGTPEMVIELRNIVATTITAADFVL